MALSAYDQIEIGNPLAKDTRYLLHTSSHLVSMGIQMCRRTFKLATSSGLLCSNPRTADPHSWTADWSIRDSAQPIQIGYHTFIHDSPLALSGAPRNLFFLDPFVETATNETATIEYQY